MGGGGGTESKGCEVMVREREGLQGAGTAVGRGGKGCEVRGVGREWKGCEVVEGRWERSGSEGNSY